MPKSTRLICRASQRIQREVSGALYRFNERRMTRHLRRLDLCGLILEEEWFAAEKGKRCDVPRLIIERCSDVLEWSIIDSTLTHTGTGAIIELKPLN